MSEEQGEVPQWVIDADKQRGPEAPLQTREDVEQQRQDHADRIAPPAKWNSNNTQGE